MASKYQAFMNGISLTGLDDRIYIVDVKEKPTLSLTSEVLHRFGARISHRTREYLEVNIELFLKVKCAADYAAVVDAIHAWAVGGYLQLSYRPYQRLDVICTEFPGIESIHSWTEHLTLTFFAYSVPYWQATTPTKLTVNGSDTHTSMHMPGSQTADLMARITNNGDSTCDALSIKIKNGKGFFFDKLGLKSGETLVIDYEAEHLLRIIIVDKDQFSRSAYDCRLPSSLDDIELHPGANELALFADQPCRWVLSAYARWL